MSKKISFLVVLLSISVFGQETPMTFENDKETKLKGDEKHIYEVPLKEGELLQLQLLQKNVDITIKAFSPEKDSIAYFDSPNGKNGLEVIELPSTQSGTYTFKIAPRIPKNYKDSTLTNFIKTIDGSYVVDTFKVLSKKEHQALATLRKTQQDSVVRWIKDESITLKSVKAETGFKDLAYLKPILKDVQVVGLGETSHGTKEIFQMKHRMLEFLVKEMGYTLFGIEASHIGCKPINDYVLYGKGNSRDALSAQGFWIWNTEEVIDMIEWMHDYNKTMPETKKVQFIGVDTQTNGLDLAYKNVINFIKKTGDHPLLQVKVDSLFLYLKTSAHSNNDLSIKRKELYSLLSYLVVNEFRLTHNTSKEEYDAVMADLRKIIQGVESNDHGLNKSLDFNIRDEYMGQTMLEVLQKQGPGSKMVLWAHNAHINKDPDEYVNGYKKPLGSVLKRYLGDKNIMPLDLLPIRELFKQATIV